MADTPTDVAATTWSAGDEVTVVNALGQFDGVVADVRNLFDEHGNTLTAYVVAVDGIGTPLLATADSLKARTSGGRSKAKASS